MKIFVVVDDENGMMFNHRRQSQDSKLREKILDISRNSVLWMNNYSYNQFSDSSEKVCVSDAFLSKAREGEYCFVEDSTISEYEAKIEELIVFRWNRRYPCDLYLDFLPEDNNMTCFGKDEFQGNSHDKILMEVWVKNV